MIEKSLVLMVSFIVIVRETNSHGMLMDPINRSSMWREGFDVPKNPDDNQNYCGGNTIQNQYNKGKCGVCGDDYAEARPRPNENGGVYGTGLIVKTYKVGENVTAVVRVTTNHLGAFSFSLCPLAEDFQLETEECFDAYPLLLADGSSSFKLESGVQGDITIELSLPESLECEHCVLRWHWTTGNQWGMCDDGSHATGCGPQENFRSCSDIAIFAS